MSNREVERNSIKEDVLINQQTVEIERSKFFKILNHFTDVCTFCFVLSLDSETYNNHTLKNCFEHQLKVSFYFFTLKKLRKEHLLTTDSCCFTCFLSTVLCY